MDRGRLLTDRSAYISFLEVQLERVTSSCLTVQAFSDRIEQLQSQILTLEDKLHNMSRSSRMQHLGETQSTSHDNLSSLEDKVKRLERDMYNLASTRPTGASPSPQQTLTRTSHTDDDVRSRMRDVELTCNRLADDAMEAVEMMQRKMSDMEIATDRKLQDMEQRLSGKMAEGIQRVTSVLKRVVASQKQMQLNQPVKVSGDVNVKVSSPVRATSQVRTASEPAGRRRRALDELMTELQLLEEEERHLI